MVLKNRKTLRSGRLLEAELEANDYSGPPINFGCSTLRRIYNPIINNPVGVTRSVDKRLALMMMQEAGVPTPLITEDEARELVLSGQRVLGRPSNHSKGRFFYTCLSIARMDRAKRRGATHWMRFIDNAREFRVHVVDGMIIKISEKVFPDGQPAGYRGFRRNSQYGAVFQYPEDFNHKKTLRRVAKEALEALGLDFAAVDILYKDGEFYVLECNSAPCLTDENSDTLERYVRAFLESYSTEP